MTIPVPASLRKPTPVTKTAVLFCENEKTPRPHVFMRSQEVFNEATGHRSSTKFIYGCNGCKNERVWGIED